MTFQHFIGRLCWACVRTTQERLAAAQAARFDREFNHSSKRYAKDVRVVSFESLVLAAGAALMNKTTETLEGNRAGCAEIKYLFFVCAWCMLSALCLSRCLVAASPQAQKKEEHDKTGFMCEHGVWRCRICQPVTKHK